MSTLHLTTIQGRQILNKKIKKLAKKLGSNYVNLKN
jgi:hypothetical protein